MTTNPDDLLKFSQEERLMMLRDIKESVLANDGKFTDKDDVKLYGDLLNSLSITAIQQKRASTEDRKVDAAFQTSANVSKLMEQISSGTGAISGIYKPVEGTVTARDIPDVSLPVRELVPGQMDTAVPDLDLDDFVK